MSATLLRSAVRSLSSNLACPSCRLRLVISDLRAARSGHAFTQQTRSASLASATAINASKNIPSRLKPLHTSLEKLSAAASSYVNLSRLQLALKSLESDAPTIRVAVLGLGAQSTARRLTRLLVADPLSEEQPWERELKSMHEDDERSVLLQYGSAGEPAPTNPLVHTINVPSPVLQSHNLEILTSPIVLAGTTAGVDAESLKDAALVPMATTPRSFSGSTSFVRYPVHRALIVANGVRGCMMLGKQDVDIMRHQESVKAAVDIPALQHHAEQKIDVAVVNIQEAERALDAFRQSNTNATSYEQGWFSSGLPTLTTWLSQTPSPAAETLPPPVRNLIDDTLQETSANIVKEELTRLSSVTSSEVPLKIREPLDDSVRFWAMRAHTELRDELETAFNSRNWTKLKWWKLFWRVDDVSMFLSDVLDRSWLIDAEKRLVWLIGRCTQAGIYDQHEAELRLHGTAAATSNPGVPILTTSTQPVPLQVSETRQALRTTTIPSLQALAQNLVMQTASFTGAGVAVSALIYSLFPAAGIYEAGAVGALVFIWTLRRMQRKWEGSKTTWQGELQERGRIALQTTETLLRDAIKGTNRSAPEVDVDGASERRTAREVVNAAAQALEALVKKG